MLQFGHGCGAVEIPLFAGLSPRRCHCFNSATAAEPWRCRLCHPCTRCRRIGASIRPRLRSRGDAAVDLLAGGPGEELQFGHGCGAVEIGSDPLIFTSPIHASIRPRLRSRGDKVLTEENGRAGSVASIRPRLRSRGDQCCQQWRFRQEGASIRPRLRSRGDAVSRKPMG